MVLKSFLIGDCRKALFRLLQIIRLDFCTVVDIIIDVKNHPNK